MREEERQRAADGGHDDRNQNQHGPLVGAEHGVENQEDGQHRDGNDEGHALVGALLAFVFAGPLQVVAGGQSDVVLHLADGLFHGRAQIAAAHGVLDGDVTLAALAIDLFRAVVGGDLGQLRQGDALAGRRQQAHVLDGLAGVAILLLIAQRHIVARLALLHLGHGVCADRSLHRVLDVGDVDAPACRGIAIHCEVEVGLADDAEDAQILDALTVAIWAWICSAVFSSVRRSSP